MLVFSGGAVAQTADDETALFPKDFGDDEAEAPPSGTYDFRDVDVGNALTTYPQAGEPIDKQPKPLQILTPDKVAQLSNGGDDNRRTRSTPASRRTRPRSRSTRRTSGTRSRSRRMRTSSATKSTAAATRRSSSTAKGPRTTTTSTSRAKTTIEGVLVRNKLLVGSNANYRKVLLLGGFLNEPDQPVFSVNQQDNYVYITTLN